VAALARIHEDASVTLPRIAIVWLLACAFAPAAAQDTSEPPLVTAALNSMPADAVQRCAYTRVSIEDDEVEVERYDPGKGDAPWTLLEIDGQPPTAAELRRYAGRAENRRDRNHPMDLQIRDMVDPSSWTLRNGDDTLAEFEFRLRPHGELTERLADKVMGTFIIDKRWQQPVRLRLQSTEAASIAPFVRIDHYAEDMRFRYDDGVGTAVLAERHTERRGRALGVKSLNRNKTFRYEDYACTPAPGSAPAESP
jgi:hypothetical protein